MTTKPLFMLPLILLFGIIVFPQASSAKELESMKPYTPTRLDWLATTLNASYRIEEKSYTLMYVPLVNQNTILVFVRYFPGVNRKKMNIDIENSKELIRITARTYGWISWVKVREDIKIHQ